MVGTIVHQLTDGASIEEIEKAGLSAYYTDHGVDVYPSSAAGVPFTAAYVAVIIRKPFYLFRVCKIKCVMSKFDREITM